MRIRILISYPPSGVTSSRIVAVRICKIVHSDHALRCKPVILQHRCNVAGLTSPALEKLRPSERSCAYDEADTFGSRGRSDYVHNDGSHQRRVGQRPGGTGPSGVCSLDLGLVLFN